jgi:hypothetical protein
MFLRLGFAKGLVENFLKEISGEYTRKRRKKVPD